MGYNMKEHYLIKGLLELDSGFVDSVTEKIGVTLYKMLLWNSIIKYNWFRKMQAYKIILTNLMYAILKKG